MDRAQAFELLKSHVKTPANISHALESEAVMRKLAVRLGQNPDQWGLCGLLHDLDWEHTTAAPEKHGLMTADILAGVGADPEIIAAIPSHNSELNGSVCDSLMAKCLAPAETVTGIVIACALVRPDRDINVMQVSSIRKKLKDKSFARNVNRETIQTIEKVGIPLDEFLQLAKDAIGEIQDHIGIR